MNWPIAAVGEDMKGESNQHRSNLFDQSICTFTDKQKKCILQENKKNCQCILLE